MGIKTKKFNGQEFEVLEHDQVPGYRNVFRIIICVAALYFFYIFAHILH